MGEIGPESEYPAMEEREKSIRALYVALAGGAAFLLMSLPAVAAAVAAARLRRWKDA
jgi:hypothetical protein